MYIHPSYRDHPLAADFEKYLSVYCCWEAEDFGQGYAWECEVPPREDWRTEVMGLNDHLRSLGRGEQP